MNQKSLLLLVGLSLCSSACNVMKDETYFGTTVPQHGPDEIWVMGGGDPQYLDPQLSHDNVSGEFGRNMFARVIDLMPETKKPIPALAQSWDISPDGTEYTFHLRKDLHWSDGKELNATDVEWSWKRLLNPATGATSATYGYVFANGEAFNSRAIYVSGLGSQHETKLEELKEYFSRFGKIEKLQKATGIEGFFIYLTGESTSEIQSARPQFIKAVKKEGVQKFPQIQVEISKSDVVQVKATNPHTVWVKLTNPIPYFLSMIDHTSFCPVPRHAIEATIEKTGRPELWTRPEHIVVSGAYNLTEEKFKQYRVLEKNPYYFDAQYVKVSKIKNLVNQDYHSSLYWYRTGETDWNYGNAVPTELSEPILKYKDYVREPNLAVYFYNFNVNKKPFDNKDVRRALHLSIDRKSIVEKITRAGQVPSSSPVPDGLNGYDIVGKEIFNPQKARELLAKAGYSEGEGFPTTTLKYNTSEGHRKIAEAVQQMWKKHLNVNIEIENLEWKVLLQDMQNLNFQMNRYAWIGDYPDPQTFLQLFISDSGNNHTGWKNSDYDRWMRLSDEETDPQKRNLLMQNAEEVFQEHVPATPIYVYTRGTMVKPYITGFYSDVLNHHLWKYLDIDERWYREVPENPLQPRPYVEKLYAH
ncbi:MAG: hypothetical protein KDD52_06060 [Bdellovibrionales bacterium]|nr:hypothetical protein [Bdellovibrionales bacterium]